MEANELRIGNLVSFWGKVVPVRSIAGFELEVIDRPRWAIINAELPNTGIEPIALTHRWFREVFCLKEIAGGYQFAQGWILCHENGFFYHFSNLAMPLKSVHEAQNLHFALTGKELNVKL